MRNDGLNVDTNRELLASGEATLPREALVSGAVLGGNGSLRLAFFLARKTETIAHVRMPSGTTAQVGATLVKIGIYEADPSGNLTLVGATANDTTLFIAATTVYTKALAASFTKKRGLWYGVGALTVGASTAPNFYGHNISPTGEAAMNPRRGALLGSQTDLPSTIAVGSLSDNGQRQYAVITP